MSLPIAINGLGRIGRALVRQMAECDDLVLVAANDLAPPEQLVGLLERDSFHGAFPGEVAMDAGGLRINGNSVPLFCEADAAQIPWAQTGARVVVEATGTYTRGRTAEAHLHGEVQHVVLSSNVAEADLTVCYGVNHQLVDPARHRLISNASCTTNCLAVVAHLLERELGIERALVNTVHCYNNNQNLTDAPHEDFRRARSAAVNMIPTTTGASGAIGRVLPELADRLDGFAVRVPAAQVSLVDIVAELSTETTIEAVNRIFQDAACGDLARVLAVSTAPLVSSDFVGDTHSAVVDLPLTQVAGGRLVRVVAWYDNEMGYASRLVDLLRWIGRP